MKSRPANKTPTQLEPSRKASLFNSGNKTIIYECGNQVGSNQARDIKGWYTRRFQDTPRNEIQHRFKKPDSTSKLADGHFKTSINKRKICYDKKQMKIKTGG